MAAAAARGGGVVAAPATTAASAVLLLMLLLQPYCSYCCCYSHTKHIAVVFIAIGANFAAADPLVVAVVAIAMTAATSTATAAAVPGCRRNLWRHGVMRVPNVSLVDWHRTVTQ